jgi:hypothetical protein
MLVCAAMTLAGASTSSASAGEATLWICHGPGGQALGVQPLTAAASIDALVTTYGTGCMAPVDALGDGGLRAAFTRPDPMSGSQAFWSFEVPSSLALRGVRLTRRTDGFGGPPVPGGGQSYLTQTSSGAVEQTSVEDATNVALDGVLDSPTATGSYVRFGVQCVKAPADRCAAPGSEPLAVEAGAMGLTIGDDAAPHGAVGGVTSPAVGTLALSVFATDAGLGLASTRATLDGALVAIADLGGASCAELSPQDSTIDLAATADCPPSASGVSLTIDTTRVPDGPHQLRVLVSDAAGNETTVADESITVRNAVSQGSNTASLSVGNGPPPPSNGPAPGATSNPGNTSAIAKSPGPACPKPRLSMMLSSRPLHVTHGIPVLRQGKAYRYKGRLTCEIGGRRVSAPAGTVIEILSVRAGHIHGDGGVTVRAKGAISVLLAYSRPRTIRFRHRSVDGSTARVSIRISVVAKASGAAKKKSKPAAKAKARG